MLADYGTGAIMAVPGQDQRDWDFAEKFDLPHRPHGRSRPRASRRTAARPTSAPGPAINSANDEISLDGMEIAEAKTRDHRLAGGQGLPAPGR